MNALYTALRRRGTTRHLTIAIVICVISAFLLFPAIIWFDLRFTVKHALLSTFEIEGLLVYVALCGWILPLAMTCLYCFSAAPRVFPTAGQVAQPYQKPALLERTTAAPRPPRYQAGVLSPFVYGEDSAWAWLEYNNGSFHGQRLALKRSIILLGRDEDCDIWLDDEMASRHHAEIAWDQGRVFLTDCGSLNGVSVNGRRVRDMVLMNTNDLIQVGSLRFLFILADQKETSPSLGDDPLAKHTWRSSVDLQQDGLEVVEQLDTSKAVHAINTSEMNDTLPVTRPDNEPGPGVVGEQLTPMQERLIYEEVSLRSQASLSPLPPLPPGAFYVQDGELAGRHFPIDRSALTVGRGSECHVVINDASVAPLHIQFIHQPNGDYIQALSSGSGTWLNNERLLAPQLLKRGDVIRLGNIHLLYTSLQSAGATPLPPTASSPSLRSLGGPMPLKLPSRMKQN